MAVARGQSEASGQTEHVYTDVQYAAGTWAQARRVVIKAEVVQLAGRAPQDNPRFRRHQSAADAAVHLRADLLCPR